MRLILIIFHLYFFLASTAVSASILRLQAVNYEVYIGGLNAINISMDILLQKNNYDINLAINTKGLTDTLFKWSMTAFSKGSFEQGLVKPRKAGRNSIWRSKKRSVLLTFAENGFPKVLLNPKPDPKALNLLDLKSRELSGARDLAGAILSYLKSSSKKNTCVSSELIFDGKRFYKLLFENQASVRLTQNQYSPFYGSTLRCQFKLKKISGFRSKTQRYSGITDGTARIWLAKIFPNATMIPVRIEMNTTLGGLFVHLISAEQNHKGKTSKSTLKF
tara:strand:- start:243 stop:1070 length:828 start_codon:yes stop_codon:yes gene_type:complete